MLEKRYIVIVIIIGPLAQSVDRGADHAKVVFSRHIRTQISLFI